MAGFSAAYAVGESLARYLRDVYPDELRDEHPCTFSVASSADFTEADAFAATTVTLFLYRITIDQYLHPAGARRTPPSRSRSLPLDLHYMLTVWTDSMHTEQLLMTWAMAQLHWNPILDASKLMSVGGFRPDESVQVSPTNITQEDLSRIWDVLEPSYRLSTTYIARIVHIDPPEGDGERPVVATRVEHRQKHIAGTGVAG